MTAQPEQPKLDTARLTRWHLELTNHIKALSQAVTKPDIMRPQFEATLTVDRETYEALLPEPLYTVEITHDLNPWHRAAKGWRARMRKARDCAWWTLRRRVLRRKLIDRVSITVPNCKLSQEPEKGDHHGT